MVDWVETRYNCTAKQVIVCLAEEVRQNVLKRCEQIAADGIMMPVPKFDLSKDDNTIRVYCGMKSRTTEAFAQLQLIDLCTIHVDGTAIQSSDEFNIHVDMDDKGSCVLSVNGAIKEPWQVARQALDRLLFPNR